MEDLIPEKPVNISEKLTKKKQLNETNELQLSVINNKLFIQYTDVNLPYLVYENGFEKNDLINIHKDFEIFEDINEIFKFFVDIDKNSLKLKKNDKKAVLSIKCQYKEILINVQFTLNSVKKIDNSKIIYDLYKKLKELKNENQILKTFKENNEKINETKNLKKFAINISLFLIPIILSIFIFLIVYYFSKINENRKKIDDIRKYYTNLEKLVNNLQEGYNNLEKKINRLEEYFNCSGTKQDVSFEKFEDQKMLEDNKRKQSKSKNYQNTIESDKRTNKLLHFKEIIQYIVYYSIPLLFIVYILYKNHPQKIKDIKSNIKFKVNTYKNKSKTISHNFRYLSNYNQIY